MNTIEFYTDGAYSSKTEMGGGAMVCLQDGQIAREMSGYEPYTTGNRMELYAFLAALEIINEGPFKDVEVNINTDSAYIANCFNNGWYRTWLKNGWRTSDRQEVKNQDLFKRIVSLYIKLNSICKINVIKVKGHSNNTWNNYVDKKARQAREVLE